MSEPCKSPERRWADLRLVGGDGMCLVDASVMPDLLGGNIDAVVMTIVEKAADMLLGQAFPVACANRGPTDASAPKPAPKI